MKKTVTITLFNGEGDNKHPYSPYNDKTFLFVNKTSDNLRDAFMFMVSQYSLSKPLNLIEPILKMRRKSELEQYSPKKINNIAIDLDEIKTKEAYLGVISYFKKENYSIILGKSRSWNGINNFNFKGIMRVNLTNTEEIIKQALSQLQVDLGDKCKVDLSVGNLVSLQAPTNSSFISFYNEKGKILSDKDVHIEQIQNQLGEEYSVIYNNEIIDKCIEIFNQLGYTPTDSTTNDNGSINFQHPSEKKSIGGFFWYSSNPLIMHHNNKSRSLSIFHLFKDTPIGKEWLKHKTKEEQKKQLIKENFLGNYKCYLDVNERYLDFQSEDKKTIVDSFLNDGISVLKIKSPMGTAKSSGIDLVIKETHKRGEKILLVSNRVSVAEDFSDKYNIMIYKDINAKNHNGSIVVQYDSLHRFDISIYDVVIFDEFASLLLHHRSNLTSNSNINAVKFKILMDTKRIVIADAFLTGYEDNFLKNRNIYYINNNYKDNIKLYEYKNKEYFVSSIINKASELNKEEHISCSFTSLNVMRVVEEELIKNNIKVITLSSETSKITRDIIYRRFKEEHHNSFQVILFTPTLTVGVSNLNNNPYHFHYDSGMSTDVISSLQMIKRSRNTKEIHYFLEERQFYYDTDIFSINQAAEKNINNFYNKKDKTLLVDIDYSSGKLKLTPLAKYINEIEVFYNIMANNHANAFKILLGYQFKFKPKIISEQDNTFTIRGKVKEIKERKKERYLDILKNHDINTWEDQDLKVLKEKTVSLTEDEKIQLILGDVKSKFKKIIPDDDLIRLAKLEIQKDFKFISYIRKTNSALKTINSVDYSKYILSNIVSSDIGSLQKSNQIKFLEYTLILANNCNKLQKSYTKNEIKEIDTKLNVGKKFEKYLKSLGYEWGESRIKMDDNIIDFIKYL